jgi:hypothetical protein
MFAFASSSIGIDSTPLADHQPLAVIWLRSRFDLTSLGADLIARGSAFTYRGREMSAPVHALSKSSVQLFKIPEVFNVRIHTYSDGSFQLARDGREASLLPVELDGGDEVDTVGWFTANPRKWWRELLVATHLGDRTLRHAAFVGKPIRLLPTPAAWIADPTDSICILDWRTDLRRLFGEVPAIVCASSEMQKFLNQRLAAQVAHSYQITVAA